jgi:hypothetical protein
MLNSAYNLPGDAGVFAYKDISEKALVFKGLLEGNLITISDDPSTITIGVSTEINDKFTQIDNSLNYLYQANIIQDGSILYLMNWNIYQDLRIQNLESSIAGGPFVKESSLGDEFIWDSSGYLDVSIGTFSGDVSTTHVFYETFLDPSLAMPSSVGGIPAGTKVYDLRGDTLTSLINDLLFPTQYPVLTGPSSTIVSAPSTILYEVSANVNLIFTSTLNRGSINPQYGADNPYRSGLPNNFNFTGIGLIDISSSTTPYISPAFDASIPLGSLSWSVAIGYNGGVQPFDNKGNPYDSSLAAGTANSNTVTITGVYPLFATTTTIGVMTKQSLVIMTTTGPITLSMVSESGGNKQAFEVPNAWIGAPINNPLTGIKTFNTISSQYEYQGGTPGASLTYWVSSSVTEIIQGTIINYTRYTYNGTDRSNIIIQLEF